MKTVVLLVLLCLCNMMWTSLYASYIPTIQTGPRVFAGKHSPVKKFSRRSEAHRKIMHYLFSEGNLTYDDALPLSKAHSESSESPVSAARMVTIMIAGNRMYSYVALNYDDKINEIESRQDEDNVNDLVTKVTKDIANMLEQHHELEAKLSRKEIKVDDFVAQFTELLDNQSELFSPAELNTMKGFLMITNFVSTETEGLARAVREESKQKAAEGKKEGGLLP